jgi:hypothetical protein
MAIEKKTLKAGKQKFAASHSENSTAQPTETAKLGDARKLAIAKLVNAKLSTAKLTTLRKLGG